MTVYHYALMGLVLVPVTLLIYRATSPVAKREPEMTTTDLSRRAFAVRMAAVVFVYGVLSVIVGGGDVAFVLGQAAAPIIATIVLFALVYLARKLLGRGIQAPLRAFFNTSLLILVLVSAAWLVDMEATRIRGL